MAQNEVKALLTQLQARRQKIRDKTDPLRAQRDALQKKIQPIEDEMRDLAQQIKALEGPETFELDQQIGQLARAMGARVMSQQPEETDSE